MKDAYGNKIYAREVDNGYLLIAGDGIVTRFEYDDPTVYPVDSEFSAKYEHPEGIVLTEDDVKKCGIEFE